MGLLVWSAATRSQRSKIARTDESVNAITNCSRHRMADAKTRLEERLIERITREGEIPFRDFMLAALYDAEFGYYNTEPLKIGAAGDYYTSSNVHPAFGATLPRAL